MSKVKTATDLLFVIEDFRTHAKKMRWDDPEVALGNCDTAASSFTNFASNARVRTKTYDLSDELDIAALAVLLGMEQETLKERIAEAEVEGPGCNFHQVSVVTLDDGSEVTIDWTARQFAPTLPFPIILLKEKP